MEFNLACFCVYGAFYLMVIGSDVSKSFLPEKRYKSGMGAEIICQEKIRNIQKAVNSYD